MAKLKLPLPLTSTLAGVSIYIRKDLEGLIVHQKGGPNKEKLMHDPAFDLSRRHLAEFCGRSTASKWIRRQSLQPLRPMADFNWAPGIGGLLKPLQVLDTASELGRRSVLLSQQPSLLAEYPLTRRHLFDAVVRTPLSWELSKETLSARISIGALLPGINFSPAGVHPLFRLVAALGAVPDLLHNSGFTYRPQLGFAAVDFNA